MPLDAFLDVGVKNTTNIGRIERGLVVMGCVLDLVRGGLASIKRRRWGRGERRISMG